MQLMTQWPMKEKWSEQTKEERQFCADLYSILRSNREMLSRFVNLLNTKSKKCASTWEPLIVKANWEIGLEVAFYRDYLKVPTKSSRKFDLTLFSDSHLVIIEAKAQSGYERSIRCKHGDNNPPNELPDDCELCKFDWDRKTITESIPGIEVSMIGLCTKHYLTSKRRKVPICKCFDAIITWQDLYNEFKEPSFERADTIYGK